MKAYVSSDTHAQLFWLLFFAKLVLKKVFLMLVPLRVKRKWQTRGERPYPETPRVTTSLLYMPSRYISPHLSILLISVHCMNLSHLNISCIDWPGLGERQTVQCQVWAGLLLGQLPVCQYTPGEHRWLWELCTKVTWSKIRVSPWLNF